MKGAAADFEQIGHIGSTYKNPGGDLDNFLQQCLNETIHLVNRKWAHVEAVAKALLAKRVLSGKEVREMIKAKYH